MTSGEFLSVFDVDDDKNNNITLINKIINYNYVGVTNASKTKIN